MLDFFSRLFDPTGFVPRRLCGRLADDPGLVELFRYSDLAIWLAYLAIPSVLLFFIFRKRTVPFRGIFLLFGAFIVSCGFTHFVDALLLDVPVYRLSAVVKLLTAIVSWGTVLALVPVVPQALALRSPAELEREITRRESAQAALQQARDELEQRVLDRTAALEEEVRQRERAQKERELMLAREKQARAEAEEANRAKDEFLATLSHELRTPLNAMLGWIHLMRGGKLDGPMTARGLEVLERNTRTQAQLIEDLLDVSRIVTGKLRLELRPCALGPVLSAAVDAVRPAAAARGVSLVADLDADPGYVLGDPMRLQQVVWNLLSNGVKFTPRGGSVWLTARRAGPHVEVSARDDGIGIGPDLLPHVFERFRQGDSSSTRKHGGLGLGLAIVRHLVELHGGTVTAHSGGENQGATFTVGLPAATAPPPADAPARAERPAVPNLRVLVVDDEPDTRELLTLVLSEAGAQVLTCASAAEALDLLPRFGPDVLISDIGMPGMDGYELLRRVRDLPPERGGLVPALALTAFARLEDRQKALASGFQVHAAKPLNPAELVTAVQALAGWVKPASL